MKLFWWNVQPNLGDLLSWAVLEGYGFAVEWAPPAEAEWVSIGSVLGWFDGFTGTVFGSGRGGAKMAPIDLTRADVRALRGQHTRDLVKGGDGAVLGDPGLLISDFIDPDPQGYLAVVPHWEDQERLVSLYPDATFVDVKGPVGDALNAIAHAERVVSSSLHGLILADAFGLPRKWEWYDGTLGDGFKFRDYGSVVGWAEPGEWFTAKTSTVDTVRSELRSCLV